jgi:hypothetical protein
MNKKASLLITAIIAAFICGLITLILVRNQSLPEEITWPTEQLTSDQAEELSDNLVSLVRDLKSDLDNNQGSGSPGIISTWQKRSGDRPYTQHISRLLNFIIQRGNISTRHLTHLFLFAHEIDDVAEHGGISIGSQVNGYDFIIVIESMETGETRRVVMRP